jgi:hypothetical protein
MTRCDGYVMFLCFVCWGRFLGFLGGPESGEKMDCGSNFPRLVAQMFVGARIVIFVQTDTATHYLPAYFLLTRNETLRNGMNERRKSLKMFELID